MQGRLEKPTHAPKTNIPHRNPGCPKLPPVCWPVRPQGKTSIPHRNPVIPQQLMHSLYLTMSARYHPDSLNFGRLVRGPPWKSLGLCLRVTKKGKNGFGKASDRAKAKDHRPQGILVVVRRGALSAEGKKLDRCSEVIVRFPVSLPSALIKKSNQALSPPPPF